MKSVLMVCTVLLCVGSPLVQAASLYRCEEGNQIIFQTERRAGCTPVGSPNSAGPMTSPGGGAKASSGAGKPARASANPTPADFPKVTGETQKSRDTDRKKILEQEVAAEQKALDEDKRALAELESTKASGDRTQMVRDRIALHERNLTALRKEVGNLK